jgi:hypothetical protein
MFVFASFFSVTERMRVWFRDTKPNFRAGGAAASPVATASPCRITWTLQSVPPLHEEIVK